MVILLGWVIRSKWFESLSIQINLNLGQPADDWYG